MKDKTLQERLEEIVEEARSAGYAITYWSPEEVGEANADDLIDIVVERGNCYLSDLGIGEEEEEY